MPRFNADFWEIAAGSEYFENVPVQKALWFETEEDRRRRHALCEFYQRVLPVVCKLIDEALTERQKKILRLYYFEGKTQEDIARALDVSQSTVSRHLFGTLRNGRRGGGGGFQTPPGSIAPSPTCRAILPKPYSRARVCMSFQGSFFYTCKQSGYCGKLLMVRRTLHRTARRTRKNCLWTPAGSNGHGSM